MILVWFGYEFGNVFCMCWQVVHVLDIFGHVFGMSLA